MYMNYMDFTNDVCMNMFTIGQRKRARAIFEFGGVRNSILSSKGLNTTWGFPAEPQDYYPQWLHVQVYPNPATTELKVFFEYDDRWKGKKLQIFDASGRLVMNKFISSKIEVIDISRLSPGIYYMDAWKEEEKVRAKFIKL